ncbi:hypothetical protein MIMGU_mgv1a012072mg [Erythranthe guttata]|uniref:Amino acid transporter transmembrane domain-containing protein n=1 Tax=Erythranthe guttata TaxID=4155 RepID=A0A022Q0B6_ERYGU|nr:hypothetical protein MIMGU_mgv1a012072mg [Erythranthe guttata]
MSNNFRRFCSNGSIKGSLTGISIGTVTQTQKIWRSFQALGDIAFAYSFSIILIGNSGHSEIATIRGENNEESHFNKHNRNHSFLHALRLHGVRSVWRPRAGKPPNRVRILQPILAPRHSQRRHRDPPSRRLPGLLPAALRLRGETRRREVAGQRVHRRRDPNPDPLLPAALQAEHVPPGVEDGVRGGDHRDIDAPPVLQRRGGDPRGARVLAADGVLPGGDVHRAEEDSEVEHEVGLSADAEFRVSRDLDRGGGRFHRRSGS